MQIMLTTSLFVGLILASSSFMKMNSTHTLQSTDRQSYRSPFRYVITSNVVINSGKNPRDAYRSVGILLDKNAFSEETLKGLFKLVSKRFPKPKDMEVWVSTNLEQIPTPEESEAGAMSEAPDDPALEKYPSALLIRKGSNELFRYTSNPPSPDMKTVVLRGGDPQSNQK
jgi:hypothetical protein